MRSLAQSSPRARIAVLGGSHVFDLDDWEEMGHLFVFLSNQPPPNGPPLWKSVSNSKLSEVTAALYGPARRVEIHLAGLVLSYWDNRDYDLTPQFRFGGRPILPSLAEARCQGLLLCVDPGTAVRCTFVGQSCIEVHPDEPEKIWCLKKCRLFERLRTDELAVLEVRSKIREFAKGSPIYLPAEQGGGVLRLAAGRVKIGSVTEEGKQTTLALIAPGEFFEELSLLEADECTCLYDHRSKKAVVLVFVHGAT